MRYFRRSLRGISKRETKQGQPPKSGFFCVRTAGNELQGSEPAKHLAPMGAASGNEL
ncbi:hypothetical protein [Olivibacter sp. XZL3]|uniref:hypothetical protein n=1 Tax=Olivibacter sp. XZL3 TaxID=1735116 RepID=UPI001416F136|nr:hypothetical protein [Olivibacter sp. XZL3]